jgi:transposase
VGLDRHDLTDAEWACPEPMLPCREPRRRGRWVDHRIIVNGVFWRTRTGSPWRDLPGVYGNWTTVYNRHQRWSADGKWRRILHELRRGCDVGQIASTTDDRHRRSTPTPTGTATSSNAASTSSSSTAP